MYTRDSLAQLSAAAHGSLDSLTAAALLPQAKAPAALHDICKGSPELARSAVLILLEIAEVEGRSRAHKAKAAEAVA